MLLVDNILLFPIHGIVWIFREVCNAAQQELESEKDNITAQLTELYMMLETQQITEEEFDAREKELLDRLDQLPERDTQLTDDEEQSEAAEEEPAGDAKDGELDDETEDEESDEGVQNEDRQDDREE